MLEIFIAHSVYTIEVKSWGPRDNAEPAAVDDGGIAANDIPLDVRHKYWVA